MKFNQLDITGHRHAKRVGRGIAAGQGKTAGRGTKGQKARAGSSKKPGFQGGTNPVMQQLPKLPGFRSHRTKATNVFTSDLELLKIKVIDAQVLVDNKLVPNPYLRIKLLNRGEALKSKLTVKLPHASQSAIENLQKAGGTFEKVAIMQRPKVAKPEKADAKKSA